MLEGVLVVLYVVVVVVGICKEVITCDKMICGRDVRRWQMGFPWVCDDKGVFGTAVEILAKLISQIGVGISVADNLYGFVASYGTVVGGNDDAIVCLCECLEKFAHCSVTEPRQCDAAVC